MYSFALVVALLGTPAAAPPNRPPNITSTPTTTVASQTAYTYSVTATDPDNDPVTFSLLDPPAGMTIDAQGVIRWTPGAGEFGTYRIKVRADDGRDGSTTQEYDLVVQLPPPPPAPDPE